MNFKKIKLNQIKYGKINEQTDIIKYNGKKLTIILSSAVCKDGIIIKNNKYYLKLDITGDVDFIGFIRDFEENNKTHWRSKCWAGTTFRQACPERSRRAQDRLNLGYWPCPIKSSLFP